MMGTTEPNHDTWLQNMRNVFIMAKTMEFPRLKGKNLDNVAWTYGVKRKRYLFGLIKQSDRRLRKRILLSLHGRI
jgi:hypothetical protein